MDKKKLFALASFSAVAGAFVLAPTGCSSSSTTTTTTDAGTDHKTPTPPPPPPPPGDDADTGSNNMCPDPTPIDPATLPYEDPAPVNNGQCTEADLTKLGGAVASAKSDDDLKAILTGGATGTCAKCVFTDANKPGWGPLPEVSTSSGPQAATVNLGGCYELVTMNKACGKSIQNLLDCEFQACNGCPSGDQTAFSNCIKKADSTACKSSVTALQTNCKAVDMNLFQNAQDNCEPSTAKYLFEGPVRVQCISGFTIDGGG
jgi:hypothetical protein